MSAWVLCTHEDFDLIDDVEVGFNEKFELVVRLSRTFYGWLAEDMEDTICYIEAYASFDEAYRLARHLDVSMKDLHRTVAANVDPSYGKKAFVTHDDTWNAFSEIIDFISRNNCRYGIRYKYAAGFSPRGRKFRYNAWRG